MHVAIVVIDPAAADQLAAGLIDLRHVAFLPHLG